MELTDRQAEELGYILGEFVDARALDGFKCVVLLEGRGIRRAAFRKDTAPHLPALLAAAWGDITKYNAQKREARASTLN